MKRQHFNVRGQALFETAIFLPLMLLSFTAILYFSQYGVLQGRAVQAVRYATLVTNGGSAANGSSSLFTLQSMYAELDREGQSAGKGVSDPAYPTGLGCSGGSGSGKADDTAAKALYLQQTMPGNVAASSPAPRFFQADATPVATCTALPLYFSGASLDNAASYMTVQYTHISAMKNTPGLFQHFLGGFPATQSAAAGMAYTLPAAPAPMMYCSQTFAYLMARSLGPLVMQQVNTVPPPFAGLPDPGNTPPARPNC